MSTATHLQTVNEQYTLNFQQYKVSPRFTNNKNEAGLSGRNKKTPRISARSGFTDDLTDITQLDLFSDRSIKTNRKFDNNNNSKRVENRPFFLLTCDNLSPETDRINATSFPKISKPMFINNHPNPPHYDTLGLFLNQHDHVESITKNISLIPPDIIIDFLNKQKIPDKFRKIPEKQESNVPRHFVPRLLRLDEPLEYKTLRASPNMSPRYSPKSTRRNNNNSSQYPLPSSPRHNEQKINAATQFSPRKSTSFTEHSMGLQQQQDNPYSEDSDDISTDAVIHNGYIITPDEVKKYEHEDSDKMNRRKDHNVTFKEVPRKIPLLPPDLLDDVRFDEKKTVKRFLSTKSITEADWVQLENLDLQDHDNLWNKPPNVWIKEPTNNQATIERSYNDFVDTTPKLVIPQRQVLRDKLTHDLLDETDQHPVNELWQIIRDMDQKIKSMDQINDEIQSSFSEARRIPLDSEKSKSTGFVNKPSRFKIKIPLESESRIEMRDKSPSENITDICINDEQENRQDDHQIEGRSREESLNNSVNHSNINRESLEDVSKLQLNTSINSIFENPEEKIIQSDQDEESLDITISENISTVADIPNIASLASARRSKLSNITLKNMKRRTEMQKTNAMLRQIQAKEYLEKISKEMSSSKNKTDDLKIDLSTTKPKSQQEKLLNYLIQEKMRQNQQSSLQSSRSIVKPSHKPIFRKIIYEPYETKVRLAQSQQRQLNDKKRRTKTYSEQLMELQPKDNNYDFIIHESDSFQNGIYTARTDDTINDELNLYMDPPIRLKPFPDTSSTPTEINWSEIDGLLENQSHTVTNFT